LPCAASLESTPFVLDVGLLVRVIEHLVDTEGHGEQTGSGHLRLRRSSGLAAFWAETLGYQLESPPDGFVSWEQGRDAWGVPWDERNSRSGVVGPDRDGPRLFFQRVPEAKSAKNRVHLDVRAAPGLEGDERMAALEAECQGLSDLGGLRVERFEP
jgi:hypothetical protein